MEIICIDGKFSPGHLEFYKKHGVSTPVEESMYTPRSVSKNSAGEWEILLNEINNPSIPIKHPIMGVINKEPAWKITRFANLDGSPLSKEKIKESIKETA